MTTRHFSFRLEDDTFDRLEERSGQSGQSRSQLAKTFIDRVERETERAEAAWRRAQDVLQR